MKGWQHVPGTARRWLIEKAVRGEPAFIRKELEDFKAERDRAAKFLAIMDETIVDTEALLGEVHA
ncbi:hypothetical protein [Arenimonas aestuarii]